MLLMPVYSIFSVLVVTLALYTMLSARHALSSGHHSFLGQVHALVSLSPPLVCFLG